MEGLVKTLSYRVEDVMRQYGFGEFEVGDEYRFCCFRKVTSVVAICKVLVVGADGDTSKTRFKEPCIFREACRRWCFQRCSAHLVLVLDHAM